jgi:hypothetical protein
MSVTRPVTLPEMKQHVLTRLGHPVVNVELADEQLEIIISDTIQDMNRYHYGDGVDLQNTTLLVSAGVSEYYVGDSGIEAAYDIGLSTMGDINALFSPTHMLLYNDWVNNGNYPGGPGNALYSFGGGGGMLTSYEVMGEYMAQAEQMLGTTYTVKYNYGSQSLIVTPTPKACMIATLKLYCRADAEKLYNHSLVKKLAVARAKIQWGLQLGKYTITLPDGSTMNGFEIMNRGYEDEEIAFQRISDESEPIDFFVG